MTQWIEAPNQLLCCFVLIMIHKVDFTVPCVWFSRLADAEGGVGGCFGKYIMKASNNAIPLS